MAVRKVREELPRRDLRRRREVELAADEQHRHPGCLHAGVLTVGGLLRPAVRQPAAAKDEVAPRVADQRAAAARRRAVVPLDRLPVRHPGRGQLAPDERLREGEPGEQRLEEEPTRVALGGREPGVDGHRAGERRRVRDRLHQPVERGDPRIVRREREAPEAGRRIRLRPLEGRCEVIGALAARPVRGAVVRIAADLLVRHFRVPEKMPGRVHTDQNGAVDALRVPPGVDQRRARTGALAQQVDLPVPEGRPRPPRSRRPDRAARSRPDRHRRPAAVPRTPESRRCRPGSTSGRGSPRSASAPRRPRGNRAEPSRRRRGSRRGRRHGSRRCDLPSRTSCS